jgi:hypothetical protein
MDPKERAKELLIWYFRLLAEKCHLHWDSDNETEIAGAVDSLVRAAVQAVKEA